jgi:protein SCO1/2
MRARHLRPSAFICGLLLLTACQSRRQPLATYNTVPPFTLTAHTGEEFSSAGLLAGKVWIADFIFTTCTGPCPRMSSQMRRLQDQLKDLPEVKLVSFTVDPENDTPPALALYAKRFAAEPGRWYFLTGPKRTLHRINREAFMLGNVDGSLDHSTRFILIDKSARVRKYYHTTESTFLPELIADVRTLLAE